MGEPTKPHAIEKRTYRLGENVISAISVGYVFILIGLVYVLALPTNLFEKLISFFGSLTVRQVPGTSIFLPAPINPVAHNALYNAFYQFCLGLILLQIVVLLLRIVWHSPIRRTAETLGNLIFWSGAAWLAATFLNNRATVSTWFAFWAGILIVLGLSLVARSIVLLLKR